MLSQKTRYALKALLELARAAPEVTLSSAAISAHRDIPVKFLEAILVELKHAGLVRVKRGRAGGYQLARSPSGVSFGEVVRLMEGPLALLPCVSVTQYRRCVDCVDDRSCELKSLFREVRDSTAGILDGWTLADALGASEEGAAHPGERATSAGGARKAVRRSTSRKAVATTSNRSGSTKAGR